eukprot:scaffold6470_cov243-Ochromonas_danica.AAC.4
MSVWMSGGLSHQSWRRFWLTNERKIATTAMNTDEVESDYYFVEDIDNVEFFNWPMIAQERMSEKGSFCRIVANAVVCNLNNYALLEPPFPSPQKPSLLLGSLSQPPSAEALELQAKLKTVVVQHVVQIHNYGSERNAEARLWMIDDQNICYKADFSLEGPYALVASTVQRFFSQLTRQGGSQSVLENAVIDNGHKVIYPLDIFKDAISSMNLSRSSADMGLERSASYDDDQDNTAIEYFVQGVAVFEPERSSSSSSLPNEETIRANVRINVSRCELH